MSEGRFSRNSTIIQQDKLSEVAIYGLGGIGSVLAMMVNIMGFKDILGYDGDIFEEHNSSTSSYPLNMIGMPKSECAYRLGRLYGDDNQNSFKRAFWKPEDGVRDVIISAVDSMDVRKELYEEWLKRDTRKVFIDLRMGAMSMEVITTTKKNDIYMSTWQPSEAISDEVCTARHTIFTAFTVASLGLAQLNKALSGIPYHAYVWLGLDIMQTRNDHFMVEADENVLV